MDRFEDNRRQHERRLAQRRAGDGGFSLACDSPALWRTSSEILGYSAETADGALGRVEDFCVEEESSIITAIVVSLLHLPRQEPLFVPLSAIERIDWSERKVHLRALTPI